MDFVHFYLTTLFPLLIFEVICIPHEVRSKELPFIQNILSDRLTFLVQNVEKNNISDKFTMAYENLEKLLVCSLWILQKQRYYALLFI